MTANNSSSNDGKSANALRILRILQGFNTLLGLILIVVALVNPGAHLSQPKMYILMAVGLLVSLVGYATMELAIKAIQQFRA